MAANKDSLKPTDAHATGGEITTQDAHATSEPAKPVKPLKPLKPTDAHATSEPVKPTDAHATSEPAN